jgi:HK97 family phage prohead protease
MKVKIRSDSVTIEGYVNAVERASKPLRSRMGEFIERVKKGAFKRAIERNDDVRVLLNHDWNRDLGGTKDGTLELIEDNIGLKARATIRDSDVIKKARNGDLVGWSFGYTDRDVDLHDENGITTRDIKDMNLYEVSILDKTRMPAYDGTLITVRSEKNEMQYRGEELIDGVETETLEVREEPTENNAPEQPETVEEKQEDAKSIDYTKYDSMITEMKEAY